MNLKNWEIKPTPHDLYHNAGMDSGFTTLRYCKLRAAHPKNHNIEKCCLASPVLDQAFLIDLFKMCSVRPPTLREAVAAIFDVQVVINKELISHKFVVGTKAIFRKAVVALLVAAQ